MGIKTKIFTFAFLIWLVTGTFFRASAAYSSLYVFGDALSATTNAGPPGTSYSAGAPYFYGQRWSNGRVWVEVLAQRQGLIFDDAKNLSYWDHNSSTLLADLDSFVAPPDVANDLFVVWVCNADMFDTSTLEAYYYPNYQFTNANIQSQANHLQIISKLYAKGVRNLIMPNAVNISKVPAFNAGSLTNIYQAGCVDYNARFVATINQARAQFPNLKIYTPDFFTLLNSVLTNAAYYGLTNALSSSGLSIDAYSDPSIATLTLNGQGTNYIFWDPQDPTAQFHAVIADVAQQMISPVQISKLAIFNGSNRLDVANVPVGLNGFIYGNTNFAQAWTSVTNFNSTATTQSIFVNASPLPTSPPGPGNPGGSGGPGDPGSGTGTNNVPLNSAAQFYRLYFPYAWSWP